MSPKLNSFQVAFLQTGYLKMQAATRLLWKMNKACSIPAGAAAAMDKKHPNNANIHHHAAAEKQKFLPTVHRRHRAAAAFGRYPAQQVVKDTVNQQNEGRAPVAAVGFLQSFQQVLQHMRPLFSGSRFPKRGYLKPSRRQTGITRRAAVRSRWFWRGFARPLSSRSRRSRGCACRL